MGSAQAPAHEDGKGGSGFLSRALIRESISEKRLLRGLSQSGLPWWLRQ